MAKPKQLCDQDEAIAQAVLKCSAVTSDETRLVGLVMRELNGCANPTAVVRFIRDGRLG